jgi:hypothetical protein
LYNGPAVRGFFQSCAEAKMGSMIRGHTRRAGCVFATDRARAVHLHTCVLGGASNHHRGDTRITNAPPMAPGIESYDIDLPPPRSRPFAGDVAIKNMRRQLSLDPQGIPEPPLQGKPAPVRLEVADDRRESGASGAFSLGLRRTV